MVAPTLRVTTAPYDRMTLAVLRTDICEVWWGAGAFSGLTQAQQDQIDRFLNDAGDRVDAEAMGHQDWCRREIVAGVAYVEAQKDYVMPADCRRVIEVTETINSKTRTLTHIPWRIWHGHWGANRRSTHPFLDQAGSSNAGADHTPRYWMHAGFDTSNPPVVVIRVEPGPSSTEVPGKFFPYYRPYFGKLADDTYIEVIPAARRAILHYAKMVLAGDKGDMDQLRIQKSFYKDEMKVLQIHEGDAEEQPEHLEMDELFVTELGTP